MSGWKAWAEQNGVYRISVGSRDEVIALGRAGKISKGDIVLCNVGKPNEHMGFYWGDAGNGFDQMWHSLTTTNGVRYYKNAKTPIGGKGYAQTFTILPSVATGDLALHKESANPGCTAGNELYSLAGARYDVFRDPGLSNKAATLTTDASGNASASGLQAGTYYVKEAVAPEGYLLDETVYTVDVPTGGTGYVNGGTVQDAPINDPAGILLGKFDGEKTYNGQANLPQGSASLAGAEFTVRYYDGFYDTEQQAEASGEPTRTWVFATNQNGYIDYQNEAQLVSGDPVYKQDGMVIIPRGTLVIRETKAPEGYELNTEFVSVQKIKSEGDTSNESTYNTPTAPEQVKRGGLAVTKVDAQTGATPQGDADFKGIEFSIVNDGGNDVKVGARTTSPVRWWPRSPPTAPAGPPPPRTPFPTATTSCARPRATTVTSPTPLRSRSASPRNPPWCPSPPATTSSAAASRSRSTTSRAIRRTVSAPPPSTAPRSRSSPSTTTR